VQPGVGAIDPAAVVWATSTAPAARRRAVVVASYSATRSLNTNDASVCGQPLTASSSFTPIGTPPNGSCTSAEAAASRAGSSSTKHTALSLESAMAANDPSSASVGEMMPARNASTREQASPIQGSDVMERRLATRPDQQTGDRRTCATTNPYPGRPAFPSSSRAHGLRRAQITASKPEPATALGRSSAVSIFQR